MKILIVEDEALKLNEIALFVAAQGVDATRIVTARDMADFTNKFDDGVTICIVDLRMPAYEGAEKDLNGLGVLQAVDGRGSRVKLLAISAYPDEFTNVREQFERRGCLLVDYNQKEIWQSVLRQMIVEDLASEQMDFLIFCALKAERAAYSVLPEINGTPVFRNNVTRLDLTLVGKKGTVVELPHMGLVDAGAMAGACIERFKPKVVGMSGVCAGFPGRAELGQLLISERAYEYQSGKWTDDGFSQEPYQVPISERMRMVVRQFLEDKDLLTKLEDGWRGDRPSKMTEPKLATFTSGSAVIASAELMEQVSGYHRRVAGLDMETYAIQRAAHIAHCRPESLCVKTVVDLADGDKNKALQPYGSFISARFLLRALQAFFADNP